MAGYHGWSMSNNAILAYENDEKPLSSWTKDDILDAIESAVESEELELKCSIDKLRKMSAVDLKDICLQYTSWHHTGKYFKETNF